MTSLFRTSNASPKLNNISCFLSPLLIAKTIRFYLSMEEINLKINFEMIGCDNDSILKQIKVNQPRLIHGLSNWLFKINKRVQSGECNKTIT